MMIKLKKFKPPKGLELNYDHLYVFPANKDEHTIIYGDTQYNFDQSDLDKICEKITSVGCTSFMLSKEDLLAVIEKLDIYTGEN